MSDWSRRKTSEEASLIQLFELNIHLQNRSRKQIITSLSLQFLPHKHGGRRFSVGDATATALNHVLRINPHPTYLGRPRLLNAWELEVLFCELPQTTSKGFQFSWRGTRTPIVGQLPPNLLLTCSFLGTAAMSTDTPLPFIYQFAAGMLSAMVSWSIEAYTLQARWQVSLRYAADSLT